MMSMISRTGPDREGGGSGKTRRVGWLRWIDEQRPRDRGYVSGSSVHEPHARRAQRCDPRCGARSDLHDLLPDRFVLTFRAASAELVPVADPPRRALPRHPSETRRVGTRLDTAAVRHALDR